MKRKTEETTPPPSKYHLRSAPFAAIDLTYVRAATYPRRGVPSSPRTDFTSSYYSSSSTFLCMYRESNLECSRLLRLYRLSGEAGFRTWYPGDFRKPFSAGTFRTSMGLIIPPPPLPFPPSSEKRVAIVRLIYNGSLTVRLSCAVEGTENGGKISYKSDVLTAAHNMVLTNPHPLEEIREGNGRGGIPSSGWSQSSGCVPSPTSGSAVPPG